MIVTVGAIPAYEDAPRCLAHGGKVIMVGMPHGGAKAEYEPVILASVGQGMISSKMGDAPLSATFLGWWTFTNRVGLSSMS